MPPVPRNRASKSHEDVIVFRSRAATVVGLGQGINPKLGTGDGCEPVVGDRDTNSYGEPDGVLNVQPLVRQAYGALRGAFVVVWGTCKSSRLVQAALLLSILPLLCV